MKIIFISQISCALFLVSIVFGQDDSKKYCQTAIQCYQDVQKLHNDCNTNKPANASSSKGNCKGGQSDKMKQLKEKEQQHQKQMIDCLQSRLNDAMPLPPKESAKCQDGGNGNAQRFIRQTTNITTTSTGGGGGGGGKGHGKGHGGKGKGNGCQQKVHQKQNQCKENAKCCSEVPYCHLKFELSDLHDQIRQLQLDVLEERRQCQKQQQSQGNQSNKGPSGNSIQRDSPIEDDNEKPLGYYFGKSDEQL